MPVSRMQGQQGAVSFEAVLLYRRKANLWKSELAGLAGISLGTLDNMVNGRSDPQLSTVYAVADALAQRLAIPVNTVLLDMIGLGTLTLNLPGAPVTEAAS